MPSNILRYNQVYKVIGSMFKSNTRILLRVYLCYIFFLISHMLNMTLSFLFHYTHDSSAIVLRTCVLLTLFISTSTCSDRAENWIHMDYSFFLQYHTQIESIWSIIIKPLNNKYNWYCKGQRCWLHLLIKLEIANI